ncbi:MAG: cysteate racemase [Ruminiclostridium sp.]
MHKTIGIIGGMGPMATASLFKKIITITQADSDQEHIHILIDNNTEIPDRSSYIIGNGENPLEKLIKSAKVLEASGVDFLIMPCNTAHYFYKDIIREIHIPFINMIYETGLYIKKHFPHVRRAGILATEGTCAADVYDNELKSLGIEIVKPSHEAQQQVTSLIHAVKRGDNTLTPPEGYLAAIQELKQETQIIILGCTELPIAHELFGIRGLFIDTLDILAQSAVMFSGKSIRKTS